MTREKYPLRFTIVSRTVAVLLIAGLISLWPDLAGRADAQADPAADQQTEVESDQTADDGITADAQYDEQIEQLALFNPPPELSEKAVDITVIPCDFGVPFGSNDIEGETYYCGIFTVPENWDDPGGPKLDLAFAVARAFDEPSLPDPVIFLAGGPGQSALTATIFAYDKLRTERDILRLDQRGTGFSQRLGLEECLVLAFQNGVDDEQLDVLRAAVFPPLEITEGETTTSLDAQIEAKAAVNRICWEQFSTQGLDLSQFTTAASARDVLEFIKALEYEQFNIHGISYGTRLAMAIMDELPDTPDAPELRSAVLDSTFPPSIYLLSSLPRNDHDLIVQLLEDCRSDVSCREAYPDLEGRLHRLLARLEQQPITADGETVSVDDVVGVLGRLTAARAGFMPKMIDELEADVLDTYLALRDMEVGTGFPEVPGLDRSDPLQAFMADAVSLLGGNVEMDVMFEFIGGVDEALVDDEPGAALQTFIEENYAGATSETLLEELERLTAAEIADSPYLAEVQARTAPIEDLDEPDPEALEKAALAGQRLLAVVGLAEPLFNTIHCIEDIQFERIEDAVSSYNDLAYPQFGSLDLAQTIAAACRNWPVEPAPIEVKDPVSSTVPSLILQGAYDTRTPVYMGRRAARELENSTLVIVPQQGHEIWTNATDCAAQIAASFVMAPELTPDLTCLGARRPQWALSAADDETIEATFLCPDGTSLETVFDNTARTVTVTLTDDTVTLPQVESGSGVRYSDGTTTFWNKGDEALVEVDGDMVYEDCVAE